MATKKISELTAIAEADNSDVLVIVDVSEGTTNKIAKGDLLAGAGHTIEIQLNQQTYQLEFKLKNEAGEVLSTQTLDLPSENAVTNIEYSNGILTITKQSGATSEVDISGLIDGLVTEEDLTTLKEEIEAELATMKEDIDENYKEITKLKKQVDTLKEITSQMPQVEGEGEEAYLADTIKAPFTEFEVKGHSEQETTEGYNLLNIVNLTTTTRNGITLTKNNDGTITLNGTASSDANFRFAIDNIVATSDYKVQIYKKGGSFTNNYISIYLSVDSSFSNFDLLSMTSNDMISTSLGNKTYTYAQIKLNTGVVCNNLVVGFQIVNDASITEFEKYTNGASPNSTYPQGINSCGDNVNELENTATSQTINGVEFTVKEDGTVIANGTATADANLIINSSLNIGKGDFVLSGCPYGGSTATYSLIIWDSSWGNVALDIGQGQSFTRQEISQGNRCAVVIKGGYTANNLVFKPKLEKGDKATPYSPYGMGCMNEKIESRNIFNPNGALIKTIYNFNTDNILSQPNNGDITIDNDNYIHGKSNNYVAIANKFTFIAGKTIYNNGYKGSRRILVYNSNGALIKAVLPPTKQYTPSESFEGYIGIGLDANDTNADGKYIMFSYDENATYSQYMGEQTISIPTQQPMRSIGDVRDEFVKKDGKWYERHSIAGYIITGNENWVIEREGTLVALYNLSTGALLSNKQLCNYKAICVRYSADPNSFFLANDNIRMYNDWNFATAQEAKAKFKELYDAGKPIYIHYILENPQDILCTQEQSDILDSLTDTVHTYRGGTYISSEDETPAYLEVSGIRDIDTMFDKVTNAIVSLGGNV